MRISDWSSDVCSSDLRRLLRRRPGAHAGRWVVIRIRAAGAEAVAAIARIHVETWRDTYAGLLPDHALLRMSAQRERVLWSRTVAAGESVLVAADSADGVEIGSAHV